MTNLNLYLLRPLVVFDLETTGLDPNVDHIVEIAAVKFQPSGATEWFHEYVDPLIAVPPQATAVHGIGDDQLLGAVPFALLAPILEEFLNDADLGGFGIRTFDLPLLVAEFARVGRSFMLAGRCVLDALTIYRHHEPRDLTSAVQHYLGRAHDAAHSAAADVWATAAVLAAQVECYGLPRTPTELHRQFVSVDVAGRFRRAANGEPLFAFGKYLGHSLRTIAQRDPGYLRWMQQQAFLDDVQRLLQQALREARENATT